MEEELQIQALKKIEALNKKLTLNGIPLPGIQSVSVRPQGDYDSPDSGVDVLVSYTNGKKRLFEVITMAGLFELFGWAKVVAYTTGKPLVIVENISGESILSGISFYLTREEGLAQGRIDENGNLVGHFNRDTYSAYDTEFFPQ
jgi:hypothetical protein